MISATIIPAPQTQPEIFNKTTSQSKPELNHRFKMNMNIQVNVYNYGVSGSEGRHRQPAVRMDTSFDHPNGNPGSDRLQEVIESTYSRHNQLEHGRSRLNHPSRQIEATPAYSRHSSISRSTSAHESYQPRRQIEAPFTPSRHTSVSRHSPIRESSCSHASNQSHRSRHSNLNSHEPQRSHSRRSSRSHSVAQSDAPSRRFAAGNQQGVGVGLQPQVPFYRGALANPDGAGNQPYLPYRPAPHPQGQVGHQPRSDLMERISAWRGNVKNRGVGSGVIILRRIQ